MAPPTHASPPSPGHGSLSVELKQVLGILISEPLYWLLAAVPVAIVFEILHFHPLVIFIVSCIAIIPLAGLMGRATENLAETMGPGLGGLLNATFGNAAELIIALMAVGSAVFMKVETPQDLLKHEELFDLVKASITGSIIGNILLVLGISILAGGLRYKKQEFNRTGASMGATLFALASVGLLIPSIYLFIQIGHLPSAEEVRKLKQSGNVELISEEIAIILAITYVLSLAFSLVTHRHLFAGPEAEQQTIGEHHQPEWSRRTSLIVLGVATAGVALMSEFLVGSIHGAAEAASMSKVFVGVIVVAIIGNAAEHSTAVLVAMKNKMDLAVNIAIGSSIQIALFVAPVLVFAPLVMGFGHPLDLHFTPMEVTAVIISIGVLALICQDGESHWMEGVMLLAVYVMLGFAFFHLPGSAEPK